MKIIAKILLIGLFFLTISYVLPSFIKVSGIEAAFVAALVFALMNAFVKPILLLFTLPLNVLTLGLFTLVINGIVIYLVSLILRPHFQVAGFLQAIAVALMVSVFSLVISRWFEDG